MHTSSPDSPICIVVNARSGRGTNAAVVQRIEQALTAAGRAGRVTLARDGAQVAAAAQRAAEEGFASLVAAGGDGTVNTVASVAASNHIPLGILPLGTLNHFARDLGIPRDLDDALAVVLGGVIRQVDVGDVNGRLFLNNASLGVYPRIVRLRERFRARGVGKWLIALWATLAVLRRRPFMAVRLIVNGEAIVRRTPFVLIANNEYRMDGISAGARDSLTAGQLWIYVMNASGRRSLLWLALQILLGRTQQIRELESFAETDATVELRRRRVGMALDGELVDVTPPLVYRIRPGHLRVLVPPDR